MLRHDERYAHVGVSIGYLPGKIPPSWKIEHTGLNLDILSQKIECKGRIIGARGVVPLLPSHLVVEEFHGAKGMTVLIIHPIGLEYTCQQ